MVRARARGNGEGVTEVARDGTRWGEDEGDKRAEEKRLYVDEREQERERERVREERAKKGVPRESDGER
jgi:hypothetical protein